MEEDRNPLFAAEVIRRGRVAVIAVRGEVDMVTAPTFRGAVQSVLDGGDRIEVDLRETTFMDSTGIAVLVHVYRHVGQGHQAIVVRDPQPPVQRVLEASGVDVLFDIRHRDAPSAASADDGSR